MRAPEAYTGRYPIRSHPTLDRPAFALTPTEQRVLDFIKGYQRRFSGLSPSLGEIGRELGHSERTRSSAHRILTALEGKGAIKREHGRQRGIAIIDQHIDLSIICDWAIRAEFERRFGRSRSDIVGREPGKASRHDLRDQVANGDSTFHHGGAGAA